MNYSLSIHPFVIRALVLLTLVSISSLPLTGQEIDEVDPNPSGYSEEVEKPSQDIDDKVDPNPSGFNGDSQSSLRTEREAAEPWLFTVPDLLEACLELLGLHLPFE